MNVNKKKRGTLKRTRLISLLIIAAMVLGLTVTALSATNWTLVGTYEEFRNAVTSPTITHIRLTNDIQLARGGAEINGNKPELVIDGAGFTIFDRVAGSLSDSIRYRTAGRLIDITVQNMQIVSESRGKQNRGAFINVSSGSGFRDLVVTFRDINFFGPALLDATDSSVVIGIAPISSPAKTSVPDGT